MLACRVADNTYIITWYRSDGHEPGERYRFPERQTHFILCLLLSAWRKLKCWNFSLTVIKMYKEDQEAAQKVDTA